MSVKLIKEVEIELKAEAVATLFYELGSDEQAEFFGVVARLMGKLGAFKSQTQALYIAKDLSAASREWLSWLTESAAETAEPTPREKATHRCKTCGALWRDNPQRGTWSLVSKTCGTCCDNTMMGDQIESLGTTPEQTKDDERCTCLMDTNHNCPVHLGGARTKEGER